jgi:hypothetical protein
MNFAIVQHHEAPVNELHSTDWPGLTALLCLTTVSQIKEGPAWLPGCIEAGPRKGERVTHWDTLALDIEAKAERLPDGQKRLTGPKPPSLSELAAELELMGLAGVLHTSHTHEAPAADGETLGPRYRLVLNPSRPILPDEIKPLGLAVVALLGLADCTDTGCLEPARLFFLPRCPAERLHLAQTAVVDGAVLDVDALLTQAKRSAQPPQRQPGPAGASVVDAFNAQADVADLLEQHGYILKGRNRWAWPGSTTGLAGVVLLPEAGRVFSHHPNDPLHGDHAHDAFSLFCTLAHGGDFRAAVKAAARMLGMERTAPAVDLSALLDRIKAMPEALVIDADTGEVSKPLALLKPVSVCDVLTNPSPPPAFVWDGYLPRGVVALFGAHGGTGKSAIALMLAVATVMGRPLFGVPTEAGSAVFVSLEDGANIVRHRLAGICRAWGIDPATLRERLHIVDGTENPELFSAENKGAGNVTTAYVELVQLVQSTQAGLVVVDNASDSFGGDEINRRQVRAFMRSLGQVARLTDCAVCLLAHVDKTTSRAGKPMNGEGYSGSTAWHNSARSRLFMTRADDGLLTLEHQKSNLGKKREPVTLVWPEGGLPMLATDAPDYSALDGRMQGRADDGAAAALLALLAEFEGRGQYCNTAANSRTHVHAVLKADRTFQRLKLHSDDTKRIVTHCQRAGWITPLEYRTADRKPHQRWTLTPSGFAFAGLPAPSAPSAPSGIDGASLHMAQMGAPSAPSGVGGVGDRARTQLGAEDGAEQWSLSGADPLPTDPTDATSADVGAASEQGADHA